MLVMFWYLKVNKNGKNKKQQYEESEHLMGIYGYPSPNVIPPPKSSRLYEGITVFDTLISIS